MGGGLKKGQKIQAWRHNSGESVHFGLSGSKTVKLTEERTDNTMCFLYFYNLFSKHFLLRQIFKHFAIDVFSDVSRYSCQASVTVPF